jgi:hypothetical protein
VKDSIGVALLVRVDIIVLFVYVEIGTAVLLVDTVAKMPPVAWMKGALKVELEVEVLSNPGVWTGTSVGLADPVARMVMAPDDVIGGKPTSLCVAKGVSLFTGQTTCRASAGPLVRGLHPGRRLSDPCTGSSQTDGD